MATLDERDRRDLSGLSRRELEEEVARLRRELARQLQRAAAADADPESLAHRLALLEEAIIDLPVGFVLYDEEDRLVIKNNRFLLFDELGERDLPGTRYEDVMRFGLSVGTFADAVGREEAWIAERLAARRQPRGPVLQRISDGRQIQIEERRLSSGAIVGTLTDVSAVAAAEERLRTAQSELERAYGTRTREWQEEMERRRLGERRLAEAQRLLEFCESHANIIFWIYDRAQDAITLYSNRFKALFGLAWDEGAVAFSRVREAVHPDDRARVTAFRRRLAAMPRDYVLEYRICASPGGGVQERYVRELGLFSVESDGRWTQCVGALIDLTDLREAMLAETRAKEQAERADREKSEFLANTSHELRTPLNAVLGFCELIESGAVGGTGNRRIDQYVRLIGSAASHLKVIVDEVLEFSRIGIGRPTLAAIEIDACGAVREASAFVARDMAAADIELRLDVPDGPVAMRADPTALRQCLLNILANCAKFTPAGGSVALTLRDEDDSVEIEIDDTGIGIAPGELERVLKPFQRGSSALVSRTAGLGVGLSITKRLVEAMGGHFAIASTLGVGTTVTFTLPKPRSG